jgi:hypothetical protein
MKRPLVGSELAREEVIILYLKKALKAPDRLEAAAVPPLTIYLP